MAVDIGLPVLQSFKVLLRRIIAAIRWLGVTAIGPFLVDAIKCVCVPAIRRFSVAETTRSHLEMRSSLPGSNGVKVTSRKRSTKVNEAIKILYYYVLENLRDVLYSNSLCSLHDDPSKLIRSIVQRRCSLLVFSILAEPASRALNIFWPRQPQVQAAGIDEVETFWWGRTCSHRWPVGKEIGPYQRLSLELPNPDSVWISLGQLQRSTIYL